MPIRASTCCWRRFTAQISSRPSARRALFADDSTPLDEPIVLEERTLTDATGASWCIQVPTAVDPRIAALLEAHREAEMEQAALRGRPLEHPEAQITIFSSLPLPGLPPTIICAASSYRRATAAANVRQSRGCLRQPNSCWMVARACSMRPQSRARPQ
jgi:hypothetical protein